MTVSVDSLRETIANYGIRLGHDPRLRHQGTADLMGSYDSRTRTIRIARGLFTGLHGGPIYTEDWRTRAWYPAMRRCGLSGTGITVHSLRHAYASMAIAAGADVKTLQRQLGHASATITLDVYASLWPSRLSEVADAVGSMRPAYDSHTIAARNSGKTMSLR